MKCAAAAVELASGAGLFQTVAVEGAEVIELVEQAAWRAPAEWLDRLRRATAETRNRDSARRSERDRAAHRSANATSCGSCPAG